VIFAAPGKRGARSFAGCAPGDIAVFSEPAPQTAKACTVFDKGRLARSGSVALFIAADGRIEMQTARAVAGRRLWTDASVRRARLGF